MTDRHLSSNRTFSRWVGTFSGDIRVILLLVLIGFLLVGRTWLAQHPEHDPWAPLDLRDPIGWATASKLSAVRNDLEMCRAVLERSEITFSALEPAGEGACRRPDRTKLNDYPLTPDTPAVTCHMTVALQLWRKNTLDGLARSIFDSEIDSIQHLGAYSCRRLYGRDSGAWSEHATANAIDISGFVLADGTRVSVLNDWQGDGEKSRFLQEVRDGACEAFSTVLSPEYNEAHRDHLHLDMSDRWAGVCR